MITSNRHLYKSVALLKEYIDKNIPNSDKLLIQIFFATSDTGHVQEIQQIHL